MSHTLCILRCGGIAKYWSDIDDQVLLDLFHFIAFHLV